MRERIAKASIIRDIAVFLLLLWTFAAAMIIVFSPDDMRKVYLVATLAMDAAIMVGYLGNVRMCVVLSGTLTCVWVSYKLYTFYVLGELITITDFALIPMPLLGALDASLFLSGINHIDAENAMLRKQVEELVLIDDVTGLYNLRAMYSDMHIMCNFCVRNGYPLSLMIVQMRYEQELKGMLPTRLYTELRIRLAHIVIDNKRLEDRLYVIDENGTMAILLTTTEQNSDIVRRRITAAVNRPNVFEGILDKGTKLDLRFACKQLKAEDEDDLIAFKKLVESELVYDV